MATTWGDDEEVSPDGRLRVRWSYESGLGNVVYRMPAIDLVATGETLIDLVTTSLECSVRWLPDGRFTLYASRQSGPAAMVLVDPTDRSFVPLLLDSSLTPAGPDAPLGELRSWLEDRLYR